MSRSNGTNEVLVGESFDGLVQLNHRWFFSRIRRQNMNLFSCVVLDSPEARSNGLVSLTLEVPPNRVKQADLFVNCSEQIPSNNRKEEILSDSLESESERICVLYKNKTELENIAKEMETYAETKLSWPSPWGGEIFKLILSFRYYDDDWGNYHILLNCMVRETESLESKKLRILTMNGMVNVVERKGNRVRIDWPVAGWTSICSKGGDQILKKRTCVNELEAGVAGVELPLLADFARLDPPGGVLKSRRVFF